MWASREMLKDNSDQQLYVKVSLRELILYGCFLFVIQYMTFTPYTPMYYKYKQAVKNLFKRQMDITNVNQTWKVYTPIKIIVCILSLYNRSRYIYGSVGN